VWRGNATITNKASGLTYTDYSEINANQSVVIFYQMSGSGEFNVLDAFVVGIDPMFSMNEQTSPKITTIIGLRRK